MKMYKKILTGMVVAVLMLGSVMGVSASESKKATISVSGDSESKYEIVEGADEFSELKAQDDVMYDKVVEYKEGKITSKELIAGSADAVKALDGKTMITGVYDLALKEGVQAGEKHEVTLLVPALTDKVSDVVVAYYDIQAGAWKTIKPTAVNIKYIGSDCYLGFCGYGRRSDFTGNGNGKFYMDVLDSSSSCSGRSRCYFDTEKEI